MNDIQIFNNAEFCQFHVFLNENDEPCFVAREVTDALALDRTAARKLDEDEKGVRLMHTPGGDQEVTTVTEPGFYKLVMRSRKPEAKAFQRWVTHDVLPELRKRGSYQVPKTREQRIAAALAESNAIIGELDSENRALKAENAELRPKALFADAVSASDGTCLVGELAKMLTQAGTTIGQNRLFERLREDGYLGKSGCNRNVPLQCYIEQGLFKIKETSHVHSDGHVSLSRTPKVTGKGQAYFMKRYGGGDNRLACA